MLHQTTVRSAASQPRGAGSEADAGRFTMETRFGSFEFGPENVITMPVGPLGFTGYRRFGLTGLANPSLARFRLLQSLDDPQLGFIVDPVAPGDGRMQPDDLEDAALSVGIPRDQAVFVVIVTVRPSPQGPKTTVNLRAPIVIDVKRALARQVVLSNSSYPIQAPL